MSNAVDSRSPLELDRERVTCLLLINTQLMKKAINIYHNILSNQQALQQLPPQAKQSMIESYQNCTRRIHCNLTVLSYIHEKYHTDVAAQQASQNKTTFPIMMSPPQDMPELNQLYTKLQELYPDAFQYLKMKINQMKKQQQAQSQQSPQGQPQQMGQRPVSGPGGVGSSNPMMTSGAQVNQRPPGGPSGGQISGMKDSQFDFVQMGGMNPQNSNFNVNNIPPQIQKQQIQGQAISPQQILQQMNGDQGMESNDNNSMMDFFNA
ncbi:uncharacterized protein CANTADRAFT_27285 [Suhomyces tanzawaensis NRRL Y-17324]|uniref:Uncharacterized protein n=1 Tax=Suhomyces tanzawaensis NRRL Y-17324 TaxID=984487 RepID=A0A1E4SD92_9ASCO|nr:uncharacterized protein CANTADRAFT_27285 [Suhomyces tanzawaensis NRRL Y-17324]ODV77484.1 hypothetical protein CANTADRAFT_27285 [Suhomyces tanzawaensis NRRL Y-17324]